MKHKRILVVTGVVVTVVFAAGLVAGNYLYEFALDPTADRSAMFEADINQIEQAEVPIQEISDEEWFAGSGYEDLSMTASHGGIKLHAYQIRQETDSALWVVLAHGYAGSAESMCKYARHFYEEGYNILLPDARGHGQSEGEYIGMGWDDRFDLLQWTEGIVAEHPEAKIVYYGISMGAAEVMMASGETLPENVFAIVEDCGYASVKEEFSHQLQGVFHLPSFPLLHFASLVTKLRAGWFFGDADAVSQVEKCRVPMLFIHGTADTFVPCDMVYEVYEAATCEKELMLVEGAGHAGAADALGEAYWQRVFAFLEQYRPSS